MVEEDYYLIDLAKVQDEERKLISVCVSCSEVAFLLAVYVSKVEEVRWVVKCMRFIRFNLLY